MEGFSIKLIFVRFDSLCIFQREFMSISQQTERPFSSNSLVLANSRKPINIRMTSSGLVCNRPCMLFDCGGSYIDAVEYVTPTGLFDSVIDWVDIEKCYDNGNVTYASCEVSSEDWSEYVPLKIDAPVLIKGIRFRGAYNSSTQNLVNIYYWEDPDWVLLYEGLYVHFLWNTILTTKYVMTDKVYIKFYNSSGGSTTHFFNEFDFLKVEVLNTTLHNGFDNSYEVKHRVAVTTKGNIFAGFNRPLIFNKGLYINFSEDVGSVFLRYLPLGT